MGYARVCDIFIQPNATRMDHGSCWFPPLGIPNSCPYTAILRKAMQCHAVKVGPPPFRVFTLGIPTALHSLLNNAALNCNKTSQIVDSS